MQRHKYDWERILGPDKMKADTEVKLPALFESCVLYLEQKALDREGVFRVPGSARQVALLKEAFKAKPGELIDLSAEEPFTICSLLGDYLRTEDPLLTYDLADEWVTVAGISDWILRLSKIAGLIEELPVVNHAQLYLLLNLLVKVGKNSNATRMGNNNLGTIFGPMICRRKNSTPATELRDVPRVSSLCIELLNRFEELFPAEESDSVGRNQKRGGRNMGAGTPKKPVELPTDHSDCIDVEAGGESGAGGEDTQSHKADKPLRSLSQMGAFYLKPKSPRDDDSSKQVTKKDGNLKLNLEKLVADSKKIDEDELRKRSKTLGAISIKSAFDNRDGGSARRAPKVTEEDVAQLKRTNTSRPRGDIEKQPSSTEAADEFDGEDGTPFTFGGKTLSLSKPKRRSTSWPEVEVAEFKRKQKAKGETEEDDITEEAAGEKDETGEMPPGAEGEIRKQFEMKKKLLELKKKELESRKAEIIKRLENSGNVITTLEEKEKEDSGRGASVSIGGETGGGDAKNLTRKKSSKDVKEDEDEGSGSESKLRRWKLRHQRIQEELKNIKSYTPRKSKSQRTKRSAKSDDEGLDGLDEKREKKYFSHDGSSSKKTQKNCSDSESSSDESSDEEEGHNVRYVIERFYGKSKSAREARRTKSKSDLREKDKTTKSDEQAFPGIRSFTTINPPSEIKRRYSEEMKRSKEAVEKKFQNRKKSENLSELSGWQLEQLKKVTREQEIQRLKKKLEKKEQEAQEQKEKEGEKGNEKEESKEEEGGAKEPGTPEKKKKRKGSARRKLIKQIEEEEKKLLEMSQENVAGDSVKASEGISAAAGQGV